MNRQVVGCRSLRSILLTRNYTNTPGLYVSWRYQVICTVTANGVRFS